MLNCIRILKDIDAPSSYILRARSDYHKWCMKYFGVKAILSENAV